MIRFVALKQRNKPLSLSQILTHLPSTTQIPKDLLTLVENVIFNKSPNATEELLEFAQSLKGKGKSEKASEEWRSLPLNDRISHALIQGIVAHIVEDTEEARQLVRVALTIVVVQSRVLSFWLISLDVVARWHVVSIGAARDRGPAHGRYVDRRRPVWLRQDVLATGHQERPVRTRACVRVRVRIVMAETHTSMPGSRYDSVMKKAVAHLVPFMEEEKRQKRERGEATGDQQHAGTIVLATVKGDVHDIGKNIVGVVLACNNYRVVDMGVMVPCQTIIERVLAEKADILGLSGLITPSLDEMITVAQELERRGLKVPPPSR